MRSGPTPEARTFLRPDGRRFLVGRPLGELPDGELFAVVDESNVASRTLLEGLGGRPAGASLELRRRASA